MRGTGHGAPGTHTRTPARDVPQPGGQTGGLSVHGGWGCRRWGRGSGWSLPVGRGVVPQRVGCSEQAAGAAFTNHLSLLAGCGRCAGNGGSQREGRVTQGTDGRAPASPHWETEGETEARGSLSWSGTVEGWRARLPVLAAVQWEMGLCHLHLPQGHASPPVSLQGRRFGDELTSEREPGWRQAESKGERKARRLGGRGPSPAQQLSMPPQCLLNTTGAGIPAFAQGVPAPA